MVGVDTFQRGQIRAPQGGTVSSTDTVVANAERYAASFDKGRLPMPPASHVLVVACMDARLNPYGLLGLSEGDAHVVRNAGGGGTHDAGRALVLSQRLLRANQMLRLPPPHRGFLLFHRHDEEAP